MSSIKFWLLFLWICLASAVAAETPKVGGDYAGLLGPLHLKLHLKAGAGSALDGTLDSIDQGAMALPCANVRLEQKTLSFEVPSVRGKWHGTVSDDGTTLTGSWSQGAEMPLVFRREEAFDAAEKPSAVDGIWLGTIEAPGAKLRVQVQVKSDRRGKEYCSLDSLDQGANGLPCDNVRFEDHRFSFEVPVVHGHWSGTLSENGNQLNGTWSQGRDLPLELTRQATALTPKKPEPPKYDDAMAPVPADHLKSVLNNDLALALKSGALSPEAHGAAVIGVVHHGARQILVYGEAKENSIFEIGSITKTFTGLIFAQMVEQGKVKLDEPVRDLLPKGTVAKPDGLEITLVDLATQHSGLPRMPDNFHPADLKDPYADYGPANLYQFTAKRGVSRAANAGFEYSNLGMGLLGQALSNRAGISYPELLKMEITRPLGLKDTVVKLSPEQVTRFAQGYDAAHHPAHAWSLDALAGAGAIRSTAGDMLTYLEAQLHPDTEKGLAKDLRADSPSTSPSTTMARAIQLSHQLRADVSPTMKIAMAWLYDSKTGNYWHNGATGGYSSYAFFNPKEDYAAVVLFNATLSGNGSFADRLGEHVSERLAGKPAISLGQ
jgi:serine-type D-Ala-D-Ala carboxypeptidase/endopeptidase